MFSGFMSCPTESHKIEDFEKKPKYNNSETTYAPKGVRILKAVKIYQGKDRKERMELEKLLGQAVGDIVNDSAWGCPPNCGCDKNFDDTKCDCNPQCHCESHCSCDSECKKHCACVGDCACVKHWQCECHKDCRCDKECNCDSADGPNCPCQYHW
jgi:hypothetical protein